MVKRLRRRPLKAQSRVRFPIKSPSDNYPNTFASNKCIRIVFYIGNRMNTI